ncbi:uncharacterized protein LOC130613498 [Hydractinia symbiolongicarpus]|uniref:uncharacterized protein LOC130613498 n=1 Tax=Hydractinia symbiolongicarpus TaxID=13093 RepID=UPI002550F231|nr:uncharacterized protein LOC130613498 [Hydractinia symbiolongicarpus]
MPLELSLVGVFLDQFSQMVAPEVLIVITLLLATLKAYHHQQLASSQKKVYTTLQKFCVMYLHDFTEPKLADLKVNEPDSEEISFEDRKFMQLMKKETKYEDGHYILPLPLNDPEIILPNNRKQAERRLEQLKRRFKRNDKFFTDCKKFMEDMITSGFAKQSDNPPPEGKTWYIPHHGVYNENKPGKIRVVFDCGAEFDEVSINKMLMSGPDLTNPLVGVVMRFREELIAFMADIEKMFYQVRVSEKHRNMYRYLWWPQNDINQDPVDHEISVHVFGAASSPSCNDLLKSVRERKVAIELIKQVLNMCQAGGFNLVKFVCNDSNVLESLPDDKKKISSLPLDINTCSDPTMERALGISWNLENDCRRIIQHLCYDNFGWDDRVPVDVVENWHKWISNVRKLENVKINRCFHPKDFGEIVKSELHHFSDACSSGYGQVSYLRIKNERGRIHCAFVSGKSRVAPKEFISIPRLELTAAVLSIKMSKVIKKELTYPINNEFFWTDSQVVLSYICNSEKRFKIFVANRIQIIKDHSDVNQWADQDKAEIWFNGPSFLWQPRHVWKQPDVAAEISEDDPEVKKSVHVNMNTIQDDVLSRIENSLSSWEKAKRVVAYVFKYIFILRYRVEQRRQEQSLLKVDYPHLKHLSVDMMEHAASKIISLLQEKYFASEIDSLERKSNLISSSTIYKLNPFVNSHGILRVGGRLRNANFDENVIHSILLPKNSKITELIVRWCHEKVAHSGRGMTLNELRGNGFWVIGANTVVRSLINKCVTCRSLRGKVGNQLMGNLPKEGLQSEPPFTYCGVDMFGLFVIKVRRNELKRYGAMFTCLSSRAIHIEITSSMDTDSFILALRRVIARRGNIRTMISDNGSNFVGAQSELRKAFEEMDQKRVQNFLSNHGTEWIIWKKNPPAASHMGGVWERQIRSVRSILTALLKTHAVSLNEESLITLMTEAEAIVNSRPLTVETLNDVNSMQPLSPSQLLTMKSKVIMPPLDHSHDLIYIVANSGEESNTWRTNFGTDGEKNL